MLKLQVRRSGHRALALKAWLIQPIFYLLEEGYICILTCILYTHMCAQMPGGIGEQIDRPTSPDCTVKESMASVGHIPSDEHAKTLKSRISNSELD